LQCINVSGQLHYSPDGHRMEPHAVEVLITATHYSSSFCKPSIFKFHYLRIAYWFHWLNGSSIYMYKWNYLSQSSTHIQVCEL